MKCTKWALPGDQITATGVRSPKNCGQYPGDKGYSVNEISAEQLAVQKEGSKGVFDVDRCFLSGDA